MKRLAISSWVMAALAVGAFAATAAASGPEYGRCIKKALAGGEGYSDAGCLKHIATAAKYEWVPGATAEMTYKTVNKELTKVTLETTKKEKVLCNIEESEGRVLNNKEEETTATFKECQTLAKACSSAGAPAGEIKLPTLQGELGIEKLYINPLTGKEEPAKNKIATNLYRQGNRGGEVVEFSCSGFVIKVRSTVLHPVSTNKMFKPPPALPFTVKFAQSGGKQKPEKFVNGPKETLESKFGESAWLQSGQAMTLRQTVKVSYEIKATTP